MVPFVVLTATILALLGSFLLLLGLILAIKGRRQLRQRTQRRRRAVLEPRVLRYCQVSREMPPAELLDERPARRDVEILERILLDHIQAVKGTVRERLIRACEQLGLVDRAVSQLGVRRWWVRAGAADKLGGMRSPRAVGPLARAMEDASFEVRLRAAQALGAIGGRVALSKLVAALREPNRWSAMRIADILAGMGEEAVDELMEELPDLPPASLLLAIDIFGRARSLKAIPLLRGLLLDADPDVRARAAHALGQIGDPGSIPDLVEALTDPSWPARAMAAKALGRIPGARAVEALCGALTDPQWWVRANAAEALKAKGDPGRRALLSMLDSNDAYAREQAVLMLQEAGVLDSSVEQLASGDEAERARAADLISKMVSIHCTDLLREMATEHPNRTARENLTVLLRGAPAPPGGM